MPRKQPDDDKPLSIEQARGKIAKAMNDLVAGNYSGPLPSRVKQQFERLNQSGQLKQVDR